MQEAFEAERKDRLEREGRILKQLGEHEQEVALRFEQERVGAGRRRPMPTGWGQGGEGCLAQASQDPTHSSPLT